MQLLDELIALAVPPRCAACGSGGRSGESLCAACRRELPWLADPRCPRCALPLQRAAQSTPRSSAPQRQLQPRHRCPAADAAFESAWAAVAYEGSARAALHALKFAAARPLAAVMAAQIVGRAAPLDPRATIVAVPAHPARRRRRGFDSADLIAAALARRSGLPRQRALLRGRAPSRQLGASRAQRRDPAALDFRPHGAAPERVVLVDDVHTTGATLDACARALKQAGARSVAAITWARTLDDRLA